MDTRKIYLVLSLGILLSFSPHFAYTQMDVRAEPYGGGLLMREFICDEMIYPEEALEAKKEGTVVVAFTVLSDGKKTNFRIAESVSPELDKEAVRICKLIMFYPALNSGNYVIDDVEIPIKFNIKKYERNCKKKGFDTFAVNEIPIDTSLTVYATKSLDKTPKPVFADPNMTFGKFITENIKYPDAAYRQNISGAVQLSFIVETSGRSSNIEITHPLGGGCSEEAIQLLKQIKWQPGVRGGKAVRSFMSVNISFNLGDNSNHQYLPNNSSTTSM